MPSVDFVQTGRVQAEVYNRVDKALGSMADYLYQRDVDRTKREAARYSFENPVSAEDVRTAIAQDRLEEVVGDPDTVFGAVTNLATAQQLRVQLANQVANRAAEYSAQLQSGIFVDPEKMRTEMSGMIDGHSTLIAQMDADAAIQYSATANTHMSSVYKLALETDLKFRQAVYKDTAIQSATNLPITLQSIYRAHTGDIDATSIQVQNALNATNEAIVATGDREFMLAQRALLRDADKTARASVLKEWAVSSEKNFRSALSGNYGDNYTSLYIGLDATEQAQLRTDIRAEMKAVRDEQEYQEKERNDRLKAEASDIQVSMLDMTYNSQEYKDAINELERIAAQSDGIAISSENIIAFDKSLADDETENFAGELEIRGLILNGKISDTDTLRGIAKDLGVSEKQVISILPSLSQATKEDEAIFDRIARGYAKIVPGMVGNVSQKKENAYFFFRKEVQRRHDQAVKEWQDAGAQGPRPTIDNIARIVETDKRQSIETDKIDRSVQNIINMIGPQGTRARLNIEIDEYTDIETIEDALRASGIDGREFNDVMRQIQNQYSLIERALERRDNL